MVEDFYKIAYFHFIPLDLDKLTFSKHMSISAVYLPIF